VRLEGIRDNILLRLELVPLYIMILLIFTTARHVNVIELSDIESYPFYYLLVQPMTTTNSNTLLIYQALKGSTIAIAVLAAGALLLAYKPYRTWVVAQLYLIAATLKNLLTKDIAWEKQVKG
jgi:hypothetical protein